MTYDLWLIGDLDVPRIRAALAALAHVPVGEVDVGSGWGDDRRPQAAALCTYEKVDGDLSYWLDIHLTTAEPTEEELAGHLAAELGVPVVYSAQSDPPSAFWLVEPDGTRTRARIEDEDLAETTLHLIDAVERPVALLPHVKVEAQPEVIRQHRMATPITDDFRAWLAAERPALVAALRSPVSRLAAWEATTVRMASGWPPDGWYPLDYFREDLSVRDQLATDAGQLPADAAARFTAALTAVDEAFRAGTREAGPDSPEPGWWWRRVPEPRPWP